jgi:glycosyltransferase involved in cell wall biosynthesis
VRVLIAYRPALRERSGVGEYTHQLVTALLAAYPPDGSAGKLALSIFSSSWKDRLTPAAELAGAHLVDRRIPVRLLNLAWHRLEWPPSEMLAGGPFDVTHSSHPLLLPSRTAAQVVTIHDLNFLSHPERTGAEIRRDYPALARDHAHRADAVVVSSAFGAGEVERVLGVARDRIHVCPPGAPGWPPRAAAPHDGYVLFLGTLEPRKNLGGLLDAYELLLAGTAQDRIPELVIAGKSTEQARPWLERIERPPLAGVVRYVGYVNAEERQALYLSARLLVLPSFEEGFGLPVLEAMSLGVPVVAAGRGSLPELVGDAGPLVDPERPDDIANAMARLLADDAYAATCASKGLARARTYSWERTAQRVYEMYRQAIDRRARRTGR